MAVLSLLEPILASLTSRSGQKQEKVVLFTLFDHFGTTFILFSSKPNLCELLTLPYLLLPKNMVE